MAYDWMQDKRMDFGDMPWRKTESSIWVPTIYGDQRVSQDALSLMIAARNILTKQNPMTLRGLYYALFGAGWIHNSVQAYSALKTIMVEARKLNIVEWDWIEDSTREPHEVQMYEDLRDYAEVVRGAYRRDIWQDQDTYIEVVIEKRTGVAQATEICRPYGVTVCSGNGYGGWSAIYETAKRIGAMQEAGKECVILYVGDFDPSGLHMFYDLQQRLRFFVDQGTMDDMPEFERLGVNDEDITAYSLPEAPGKKSDTRKDWMLANYGKLVQVEMDALWSHTSENIFQEKVRKAIESYLDMQVYRATKAREEKDVARLNLALDKMLGGGDLDDEEGFFA